MRVADEVNGADAKRQTGCHPVAPSRTSEAGRALEKRNTTTVGGGRVRQAQLDRGARQFTRLTTTTLAGFFVVAVAFDVPNETFALAEPLEAFERLLDGFVSARSYLDQETLPYINGPYVYGQYAFGCDHPPRATRLCDTGETRKSTASNRRTPPPTLPNPDNFCAPESIRAGILFPRRFAEKKNVR